MTPAEREALKLAAEKATPGPWKKNNGQGYEHWVMSDHVLSGAVAFPNTVNENVMNDAEYIAAASPDVILHLLSLISSLELTLSNSTNLNVMQMERIENLETEHSALKLKYALCDSDIPAGFSPDLEPSERISAYIGKVRECLIDHHRLHGVRCFHGSRAECPTMQLTNALLAAPTEPTPEESE